MGIRSGAGIHIVRRGTADGNGPLVVLPSKPKSKNTSRPVGFSAKDIKSLETFTGFNGWAWGGFGYLGGTRRSSRSDKYLAEAANELGLDREEIFLWANSKPARHFMDGYPNGFYDYENSGWGEMHTPMERVRAFRLALAHDLPELLTETGYSKKS
jgi:hypothetical protein